MSWGRRRGRSSRRARCEFERCCNEGLPNRRCRLREARDRAHAHRGRAAAAALRHGPYSLGHQHSARCGRRLGGSCRGAGRDVPGQRHFPRGRGHRVLPDGRACQDRLRLPGVGGLQ